MVGRTTTTGMGAMRKVRTTIIPPLPSYIFTLLFEGGLSDALQIPAGFRSFLWIPEEFNLAETPSQNYYSGGYKFQWNEFILELAPECSPEFTGTECHQNPVPGVFIH
jgi:hypothetical protein